MCVLHLCGDQDRTVRTNKPGMRAHAKRDTQKLPLRATREGGSNEDANCGALRLFVGAEHDRV